MISLSEAATTYCISEKTILGWVEEYQITITQSGSVFKVDETDLLKIIQLTARINDCKGELSKIFKLFHEEVEIRKEELNEVILRMDDFIDYYKSIERISPLFKIAINEIALLIPDGIMRTVFIEVCHSKQLSEVARKHGISFEQSCLYYNSAIKYLEHKQDSLIKNNDFSSRVIRSDYARLLSLDLQSDVGLGVRACNSLASVGLRTVADLLGYVKFCGFNKLKNIRNLGSKTLQEIIEALINLDIIDMNEQSELFRFV